MTIHNFFEFAQTDFNVSIISVSGKCEVPLKNFRCLRNTRPYDRFFYVEAGEFKITEDGQSTLTLHAGDLIYLQSDCTYTSEWTSDDISYWSVEFLLNNNGEPFSLADRITFVLNDKSGSILDTMKALFSVWAKGEIGYKIKTKEMFFKLMHHVTLRIIKSNLKVSHKDIYPAVLYIENNYLEELNVTELSRMCSMSESSFRKKFHNSFGMPPITYRNNLRVQKAIDLLSSGEYNVTEASEMVGFCDLSYFNRLFQKFTGKNPSEFIS